MKKKSLSLILLVMGLGALVLAACTPAGGTAVEGVAQPTTEAEAPAVGEATAETQTLYVGPELVDCTGVGPMQCMQVRRSLDEDYTLFYDPIEGFTFEPGFEYELVVSVTPVENPPADASSLKYTLVEMKSKTPVSKTTESSALEGTLWVLQSYLGTDGQVAQAIPDKATAEFKKGQVAGNASCNRYTGSYTVDGSSLTISPLASTMMACVDSALQAQETQFLALMQTVASYAINGGNLELADASGQVVLTFAGKQATSLTGTTWVATSVNNGKQAVTTVVEGSQITAVFGEDGSLSGSAGCNTYNASFTVDGQTVTISQPASTMMACADEAVNAQEMAYLMMLPQAGTYAISGDTMELRTADGALIASYVASAGASVGASTEGEVTLEGPQWVLSSYLAADGSTAVAMEGVEATAVFKNGELNGNGGCNSYGGGYTVDGSNLTIGQLISTMMACDEAVMAQEQALLANLQAAATYAISGDTLEIMNADGAVVLTFTASPEVSLTGTTWVATMVNNGNEAVTGVVEGSQITLVLAEDGSLSGTAGCNNYMSGFTADGGTIAIEAPAGTRMMCEGEDVMAQEAAYLLMLPQAATYTITGDTLELRTADGALIASFVPAN